MTYRFASVEMSGNPLVPSVKPSFGAITVLFMALMPLKYLKTKSFCQAGTGKVSEKPPPAVT